MSNLIKPVAWPQKLGQCNVCDKRSLTKKKNGKVIGKKKEKREEEQGKVVGSTKKEKAIASPSLEKPNSQKEEEKEERGM